MQLQVVLDRLGFSPGVIDGREGQSLTAALRGFQRANRLTETGRVDEPTRAALAQWDRIPSTRTITIDAAFAAGPFTGPVPREPEDQARLSALGYADLTEKLAERFHTTRGHDPRAQPRARLRTARRRPDCRAECGRRSGGRRWRRTMPAGARRLASLGVAGEQPRAARIVVDKSEKVLMAYDAGGSPDRPVPRDDGQHPRSAAARPLGDPRASRTTRPSTTIRPCSGMLRPRRPAAHAPARPEQPGRRGLDRPVEGALRHSRHARAADDRPHREPLAASALPIGTRPGSRRWCARGSSRPSSNERAPPPRC